MAAYTGSLDTPANQLGYSGKLTVVRAKFTFSSATLATTDTFTASSIFTQNGIDVPVIVRGVTFFSSTTTPASLQLSVGNSDDADGYIAAVAVTETGQAVRKGAGDLVDTRVTNSGVTMTVTNNAGAAYTGDLFIEFLVETANS